MLGVALEDQTHFTNVPVLGFRGWRALSYGVARIEKPLLKPLKLVARTVCCCR